ncbi:YeeE/YedE thiosulfate transporter family protein [Magnetovibrio sp. PR-2]|uniref:YeeE/YedE thiosulfate transporter family protein n=1 Tax=Magnetovibrio sp. PR-2 TaxID=3120356 RepID=UPI002FCE4BC1
MSVIGECIVAFIFGTCVGLLVQRSRFCNTAALRDAMLFSTYRNTKALLMAMIMLTFGFTLFITFGEGKTMHFDVGFNTFAGLFIFGVGMVLAGACTVSTWVKAGEGNFGAVWALIFTFIGMFLFSLVWSVNYWPPAPSSMTGEPNLEALQLGYANAATLQEKFGIPAIFFGLIQMGVLAVIYRAILRKEAIQAGHHKEVAKANQKHSSVTATSSASTE